MKMILRALGRNRWLQAIYWVAILILSWLIDGASIHPAPIHALINTLILFTTSQVHTLLFIRLFRRDNFVLYIILSILIFLVSNLLLLFIFGLFYGNYPVSAWFYTFIVIATATSIVAGKTSENIPMIPVVDSENAKPVPNSTPGTIFIKSGNKVVQVRKEEIRYIRSDGNYTIFYLSGRKIMTLLSLRDIEDILGSNDFVRVHKSYIISLKYIEVIENYQVRIDSVNIPIGKTYRRSFDSIIKGKMF